MAEYSQRLGQHELAILPEHGPGAVARNAHTRYVGGPRSRPDPRLLDVEVRDLSIYDRLADAFVGARP